MKAAIGLVTLLMTLADTGTEAAAPPSPSGPVIDYEVVVLEMKGLDWRAVAPDALKRATRRPTDSIWTTDLTTARAIRERGREEQRVRALAAQGVPVTMQVMRNGKAGGMTGRLMAALPLAERERILVKALNDPSLRRTAVKNKAAAVPVTTSTSIVEGYQTQLSGRLLEQGILTKVRIDATHIAAVHTVGGCEGTCAEAKVSEIEVVDDGEKAKLKVTTIPPKIEVPEVIRASLTGEWLIPDDGVLVASLGVYTVADDEGKAVTRELLALVTPTPRSAGQPIPASPVEPVPGLSLPAMIRPTAFAPRILFMSPTPFPAPILPSRTLPQGFRPDGKPEALPPLPPQEESDAADPSKPSAQGRHVTGTPSTADPSARAAKFNPEPTKPTGAKAIRTIDAAETIKPQTYTFRMPVQGSLGIEIKATIRPKSKDQPAEPAGSLRP